MSLSYSALKNRGGNVTLPSVDSWGTNNNIIRDPYKSVHTRRIDKVGDDMSIIQTIEDSSNRACEAIRPYARGQNPMVSVSYSNSNGAPSKLPYTIMKDGAFRPPIRTQRDLLPLSRLPRANTCVASKPGFIDFSKKLRTCGTAEQTIEVHNDIVHATARPTISYNLSTQAQPTKAEINYVIQTPVQTAATSGMRTMDITQQVVKKPTKEIDNDIIYPYAMSNLSGNKHVNNNTVSTGKFIVDDAINTSAITNSSIDYLQLSSFEEVFDRSNIRTKDVLEGNYSTNIQGNQKQNYIHSDMELDKSLPNYHTRSNTNDTTKYVKIEHENKLVYDRNMPNTSASSNINDSSSMKDQILSRNVRLAPKINPGGFNVKGNMPVVNKINNYKNIGVTNKSYLTKRMNHEINVRN